MPETQQILIQISETIMTIWAMSFFFTNTLLTWLNLQLDSVLESLNIELYVIILCLVLALVCLLILNYFLTNTWLKLRILFSCEEIEVKSMNFTTPFIDVNEKVFIVKSVNRGEKTTAKSKCIMMPLENGLYMQIKQVLKPVLIPWQKLSRPYKKTVKKYGQEQTLIFTKSQTLLGEFHILVPPLLLSDIKKHQEAALKKRLS